MPDRTVDDDHAEVRGAALDAVALAALGIIENFGDRQLTMWWRVMGVIDFFRNKQGWGAMTRKRFSAGGQP